MSTRQPNSQLFRIVSYEDYRGSRFAGADPFGRTRTGMGQFEAIEHAGREARAERIARGEIMTCIVDGWVVGEYPGGRVERLAPVTDFRGEDFPYPR